MPYLDQLLPYNGITPISRHCSAQAAQSAEAEAVVQIRRYLRFLYRRGAYGATDLEAVAATRIQRSSINARRGFLMGLEPPWVDASGKTRLGPTKRKNTVWVLTDAGRAAVEAGEQA